MTLHLSSVAFTRPENTTAYTSGDVVAQASPSALVFPVLAPRGFITKVNIKSNNPSNVSSYTLWLFDANFTGQADNGARTFTGNMHFDFLAALTTGASVVTSGSGTSNEWNAPGVGIPYVTPDSNLYGLLSINAAVTPSSGQQFLVEVFVDTSGIEYNRL